MSVDWFCKIGDTKIGPLSGKQLKAMVAKGQLKPEHLLRRGNEGPWVSAGRVKGLFPDGVACGKKFQERSSPQASAKPLPRAAAAPATPPVSKNENLPNEAKAVPSAADIPQELTLGGQHKHHVELNVDRLNIEATPIDVSRRKVKAGIRGLKKEEQKKLTIMLFCLIGVGTTAGLIAIIWAAASGQFSNSRQEGSQESVATAQPIVTGGKVDEPAAARKPSADAPIERKLSMKKAGVDVMVLGDVELMVLKPTRGAPPKGAKCSQTEVLVVPVRLNLKQGDKKTVQLASWMDDRLKSKVSLQDDKQNGYEFLEQVAEGGGEVKAITDKWAKVYLVFRMSADKKFASLQLALPSAAYRAGGPLIGYTIQASDIRGEANSSTEGIEEAR
jgi:hypothetical protein